MLSKALHGVRPYVVAFALVLSMNSYAAPTSGGYMGNMDLETNMMKGERAPFNGVLVPYPQYYYYNEQVDLNIDYASQDQGHDCVYGPLGLILAGVLFFAVGLGVGTASN